MGCPYSSQHSGRSTAVLHPDDGPRGWRVPAATDAPAADVVDFGCYGRVVNDAASGPAAFSVEQRRLIRETWTKMSPQSTAIGKQVSRSF